MSGRQARAEVIAHKAKLLREEYRGLQLELASKLAGADLACDATERREELNWGLRQLFDMRARLEALPDEVASYGRSDDDAGYFDDLELRIDELDDRRRHLIREDARREATNVRRELLALQGVDAMCDDSEEAERKHNEITQQCEEQAAYWRQQQQEDAADGGDDTTADGVAEGGGVVTRQRDCVEQVQQLSQLLDEREEELRELRRTIARGQVRSEEERIREREDAVATWQRSSEFAERLDAARLAGRQEQRRADEEERTEWRRKRDEAEAQYLEQAAGRAAGVKHREAQFATQEASIRERESKLAELVASLSNIPEVAKVLPELQGLCGTDAHGLPYCGVAKP